MGAYNSTLLIISDTPSKEEINKALLDLLAKINEQTASSSALKAVPVGIVFEFAGPDSKIPDGFLLCNGAAVSRQKYAALYDKIGTTWGAGDGSKTFNLPDYRGASPAGAGTSAGFIENETLALGIKYNDQIMDHSHGLGEQGSLLASGTARADVGRRNTYVPGVNYTFEVQKLDGTTEDRKGLTTHGKLVGVNFIIKY